MSAEKLWHSLLWKTEWSKLVQGRANKKSSCKLFGLFFLFPSPPSAKAICFDPLRFEWHYWNCTYREDPLLALCTEIQEKPKEKNQWRLLMSFQDAVSRRPKDFFKIPADSPRASNVSQKGEVMDVSERL